YYGGLLSQRKRSAAGLEAIVHDYFHLPVRVLQFQGRWLRLEPEKQTRLGERAGNARLSDDAVIGDRVWDVQGKIRLRIGPLPRDRFIDFLPDRRPYPERKSFFTL